MSHTVTTKVEYKNLQNLESAVLAMGGQVIGEASHNLFQHSNVQGWGFRLPGWQYPLVLTKEGELKYDDYNGRWGNPKDLEGLKGRYIMNQHKQTAADYGWVCEEQTNGTLLMHDPAGGGRTLTMYPDGTIDANGYGGCGCAEASALFSGKLGAVMGEVRKEAFYEEHAQVQQAEGQPE